MLIYNGSSFFQLLEGRKETVEDLFGRIKTDDRHIEIKRYHSGAIEHRSFETWAMAYRRLPEKFRFTDWVSLPENSYSSTPPLSMGARILKLLYELDDQPF